MEKDEIKSTLQVGSSDRDLLKIIFDLYQKKVYRIAYGMIRNREDALDIVQEVFIKLFNSLKNFRGDSNIYTYIYRTAINTSIDYMRKIRKSSGESFDDDLKTKISDSDEKRPDRLLIEKELEEKIREALNKLPKKQRAILTLREVEGLSYEEISKVIGCSIGTVMSSLHYGRRRMKKYLKEYIKIGEKS